MITAPYDARVVANFILRHHHESREEITQLRLYKLLYFSHGWYLAEKKAPLVWNYFEAWKRGPVIKVVRDNFEKFGKAPITRYASMFDLRIGSEVELPSVLNSSDESFVEQVVASYRPYSADQLSLLTHMKDSPWDRLWNAKAAVGRFGLRLTDDEILTAFEDLVEK